MSLSLLSTRSVVVDVDLDDRCYPYVCLENSPFQPKSRLQICDRGCIQNIRIWGVDKVDGVIRHYYKKGAFRIGDKVSCFIDPKRRQLALKAKRIGSLFAKIIMEKNPDLNLKNGRNHQKAPWLFFKGDIRVSIEECSLSYNEKRQVYGLPAIIVSLVTHIGDALRVDYEPTF